MLLPQSCTRPTHAPHQRRMPAHRPASIDRVGRHSTQQGFSRPSYYFSQSKRCAMPRRCPTRLLQQPACLLPLCHNHAAPIPPPWFRLID
ncbi:hypothetical protein U1Q18_037973 [Sarracenia purpurea var. burkii]